MTRQPVPGPIDMGASAVLAGAVLDVRRALATRGTTAGAVSLELVDELLDVLARPAGGQKDARALGRQLASIPGDAEEGRAFLAGVLALVARRLAAHGSPPSGGGGATAWQGLVIAVDLLRGSGASALPAVKGRLLRLLEEEATLQLPRRDGDRRSFGEPGPVLRNVAVSRRLCDAIERAFGFPVTPAYEAVYIYEPSGTSVATQLDPSGHEIVLHLILEHSWPRDRSGGSALLVHLPAAAGPVRLGLRPGEAVALRGRGTLHSWERLQPGEHRTRVALGFERAAR